MENIINKLGHSRLLEYFLIMWIVTLVAIKLIDRSMYYILVLTEKKKRTGKKYSGFAYGTIILKFE
jgi:hypothetical protein